MCMGTGGGAPKVKKAPVAPSIVAPVEADEASKMAGEDEKKRRLAAQGRSDTILTGGMGLSDKAAVGSKKLLGQ